MPDPQPTPEPVPASPHAPSAKAKRRGRKLPTWLTAEEASRLLAATSSPRDWLLVAIGLFEGLRVSELVKLQVGHIDLAAGALLVSQGKGGKDRRLPLHPDLEAPLRAWIAGRTEGWLFPSPASPSKHLTSRAVQYLLERLCAVAGIRRPVGTKRPTPHTLRHTFASRLVERGADIVSVRDLMGHSSVSTTQVYLHADQQKLRSEIAKL